MSDNQRIKVSGEVDILKDIFYQDGSLRDLYVCETTADDWQQLISFLRGGIYQVAYEIDGVRMPLPPDYGEIEKKIGAVTQLLSINVDGVCLNCHFFWTSGIEFDLLPTEIDTEEKAEAVFRFMAEVGQLLRKDVILTPENMQENPIVRYDSTSNEMIVDRSSN